MKKIFILFIFLGFISSTHAQETNAEEIETLLQRPSKVRGYVSPYSSYTTLDNEIACMNGFHVAGIFNDHFVFGFYNVNLDNNIRSNNPNFNNSDISFEHKGVWLGYIFFPKRMIHFNTNVQAGKGKLELYDDFFDRWLDDDQIYVITPSVEVEFNVAKFLRVGLGANYQFALDVDRYVGYNDEDFSNLGAFVNFKFGWFK